MVTNSVLNAMTVDVEDYFQVSAFENQVERDAWTSYPCRVERNVDAILGLFSEHKVRATFFTLGWVAEKYPQLVRQIAAQGHEVASHGFEHVKVHNQNEDDFRRDVRATKTLLEDTVGAPITGYRAASFSIDRTTPWAFDVLADEGYRYSSSLYPIRHDHYGAPDSPRFAFQPNENSEFLEIPITTVNVMNRNFPCGGGGYFRLLPYSLSRWALERVQRKDGQSCIFYFHPWEIDPEQPTMPNLSLKTRFRHYVNLGRMERRLAAVLKDFQWGRVDETFLEMSGSHA